MDIDRYVCSNVAVMMVPLYATVYRMLRLAFRGHWSYHTVLIEVAIRASLLIRSSPKLGKPQTNTNLPM